MPAAICGLALRFEAFATAGGPPAWDDWPGVVAAPPVGEVVASGLAVADGEVDDEVLLELPQEATTKPATAKRAIARTCGGMAAYWLAPPAGVELSRPSPPSAAR